MSEKQDRVHIRTAAQFEQKYNFNKSFAEVMGIATDARKAADKAADSVNDLNKTLSSEEIFNRLTENGTLQGLFRGEDGELYINAEFIQALDQLFAKNITMSGKFTYSAEVFLEPGIEEATTIQNHVLKTAIIPDELLPLYDFNGDGEIKSNDALIAVQASKGFTTLANWSGAKKSKVTLTINMANPAKIITISGTNMWGRKIEHSIGANSSVLSNLSVKRGLSVEGGLTVDGKTYGENKVLWTGRWYMTDAQTISLSEKISDQHSGIVLIFSSYNAETATANDYHFNSFFIPKEQIKNHDGGGHAFLMVDNAVFDTIGSKYLHIYDKKIVGNANNTVTRTSNGITFNNKKFVLRYVIGV